MDEETKDFLSQRSKFLNGQLRGAINARAREENQQLIELTFIDIWDTAHNQGLEIGKNIDALNKLKQSLKEDNDGN